MARGNVARFLSGAICIPTIPDNVITRVDEVWYSACEKNKIYTLLQLIFAFIILELYSSNNIKGYNIILQPLILALSALF